MVDIFDAILGGRVTTGDDNEGSLLVLDGRVLIAAVLEAARPKAVAR